MQNARKHLYLAGAFLFSVKAVANAPAQLPAVPLSFELNDGQAEEPVKYRARTPRFTVWITSQGATIGVRGRRNISYIEIRCEGGNPAPVIQAEDKRTGISNYFSLWEASPRRPPACQCP